jgi:hypothetical protein
MKGSSHEEARKQAQPNRKAVVFHVWNELLASLRWESVGLGKARLPSRLCSRCFRGGELSLKGQGVIPHHLAIPHTIIFTAATSTIGMAWQEASDILGDVQ